MNSPATARICHSTTIGRRTRTNVRNHLVAVLALLCCACLTTCTVAADSITIDSSSTPTSTCQDNPDFRKNKRKSCKWVASRSLKKQTRLCSRKSINKHCPKTCKSCDILKAIPICPDVKPAYGTDCSQTGATLDGCPYDFIVVGCTAEDLKCVPISTYFCEFQEGSWTWQVAMMGVEYCANGTEGLPSEKCNPADYA